MVFLLNSQQLPIVRFIGEISFHEPWFHFQRTSKEYILYIMKRGELFIEESGIKYHLTKKDFFLFEPGKTHVGYKNSICDYFYIHFSHPDIKSMIIKEENVDSILRKKRYTAMTSNCLANTLPNDSVCYLPKHYTLEHLYCFSTKLKEMILNYDVRHENYKEIISCEFLSLLIKMSRDYATLRLEAQAKHISKPLYKAEEVLRFLNINYSQKITSDQISSIFESNYDYLSRCFKKLTGYTIFTYLNMIRISKAQELILTTHMKYGDIGFVVGIDNPYYFSKLFKQHAGLTPSEFYFQHCQHAQV